MADNRYKNNIWQGNYKQLNADWNLEKVYNPFLNGWDWLKKDTETGFDVFIQKGHKLMKWIKNKKCWTVEDPDGDIYLFESVDCEQMSVRDLTFDLFG